MPPRIVLERRRSHTLQSYSFRAIPMTSIDLEFPPVPQLSPADEIHVRQALRRNRLLATGLLTLMIVIAIATHFVPSPGWLVQLVRAGRRLELLEGWLTGSRSLFCSATLSEF